MKNITAQYKDLLEGKMSKANFMNSVRQQFPDYIHPVNSFEDMITILKGKRIITENEDWEKESRANQYGINPYGQDSNINDLIQDVKDYIAKGYSYEEAVEYIAAENDIEADDLAMMVPKDAVDTEGHEEDYDDERDFDADYEEPSDSDGIGAWEGKEVKEGYDEEGEGHSLAIEKDLEDRFERNEIDQMTFSKAIVYVMDHDYDLYANDQDADYVLQQVTGVAETYLNEATQKPEGRWKKVTGKDQYNVFDEIDRVNPYEFRKGVTIEMGMQNLPTPNTFTDKFNPETIQKATKKVLKNLAKDPAYYTNMISAITEKRTNLPQEAKEVKTRPDGKIKVKGFNDAKSNTEITLSKRERAKGKPEGVKEMKPSGKSMGGIKTMKSNGKVPKGVEMMKEAKNLTEAIKAGDKVKIDPEVFPNINDPKKQVYSQPHINTNLSPKETYIVKSLSGTDAVLMDNNGTDAGYVNLEFVFKVPDIFTSKVNLGQSFDKLKGLQEIKNYVAAQIKKDFKRK